MSVRNCPVYKADRGIQMVRFFISVLLTSVTATFAAPMHSQESTTEDINQQVILREDIAAGPKMVDAGLGSGAKIEEVYVTGSLLPKGNFESNAPITTITSDQFEISNAINIEQLLNTMPQILTGADRTSTFGLGWATADLRGLGTNRTLTLMDGNRLVPTFADGGTVDLNIIPPGLVERVEILTGGASTTYGSDAMAGVINIITKENFFLIII